MRNISVILLLVLFGCTSTPSVEEPDPQQLRAEQAPTPIKVAKAVRKPFVHYIETNGTIEAAVSAELKFEKSGKLVMLKIRNNKNVAKGNIIAQLDDAEARLALRKAEAMVKSKQFDFQSQMLSYGSQTLNGDNGKTITESLRHSSGLVDAEIALEEAQFQLNQTRIYAPISGTVSNISVKNGHYASAGDELCEILDLSQLLVVTSVLETDFYKLKNRQKALIKPVANGYDSIETHVVEINPVIDEGGTVQVKLKIHAPEGLMPGMNVSVKLEVPVQNAVVVPKEAVVIRSGREVVFVYEDGLAKWNYVTTGLSNGYEVEIREGLEEGSEVVVANNLQLAHDAAVVKE